MADKTGSQFVVRCDGELPAALDALASGAGVSRNRLVVQLLEAAISGGAEAVERASGDIAPGLPVLQLSTSQLACLDQLAERAGVSRVELMARYLGERLKREFVESRQRQMAGIKPRAGRVPAGSAHENGQ